MKFFLQMFALCALCAVPFYLADDPDAGCGPRVGDRFDGCTVAKVLPTGVLVTPDDTPQMELFVCEDEYELLHRYGVKVTRISSNFKPGSDEEQIFLARQAMIRARWAAYNRANAEG